ncbi:MAG: LON peptidase substrate-binding domain-containing protein [Candidatus Acidiferrales bacterium]
MKTRPTRIPLFPLDVVLLPGMAMPLHIFEPRYKQMIGKCLADDTEFGMILATSKGIATVGCAAAIVEKVKDYPDGRMDILAEGRAVFDVREILEEQPYYEAVVAYLEDEPASLDPAIEKKLRKTFEDCHELIYGQEWEDDEGDEAAEPLAYRLAAMLPMELEEKQRLLEMRNEIDRRAFLQPWLEQLLPKLLHRQQVRQRASGNGHGLN